MTCPHSGSEERVLPGTGLGEGQGEGAAGGSAEAGAMCWGGVTPGGWREEVSFVQGSPELGRGSTSCERGRDQGALAGCSGQWTWTGQARAGRTAACSGPGTPQAQASQTPCPAGPWSRRTHCSPRAHWLPRSRCSPPPTAAGHSHPPGPAPHWEVCGSHACGNGSRQPSGWHLTCRWRNRGSGGEGQYGQTPP